MLCPNCETRNNDGARFCDKCGFPLGGASVRIAPIEEPDAPESGDLSVADEPAQEGAGAQPEAPEEAAQDALVEEPPQTECTTSPDEDDFPEAELDDGELAEEGVLDEQPEFPDEDALQEEESADEAFDGDGGSSEESSDAALEPVGEEAVSEIAAADNPEDGPDVASAGEKPADGPADKEAITPADVAGDFLRREPEPHSVDFAGFDRHAEEYGERLVDDDFDIPAPVYRDGGTMQMPRVGEGKEEKNRDYRAGDAPEEKKPKSLRLYIVSALVLCGIVALAIFGTYQMQMWGGKIVPDVNGMTEADAYSVLSQSGFTMRTTEVKSDDTEGLVILTDPASGWRVDEGSEVVVHVATSRIVPEVVGKTKAQAGQLLAKEGYENVRFEQQNSDEEKGTVVAITPEAGSRQKSTAEIVVSIAQPYTVPDVTGMNVDEAIEALKKAKLDYETEYVDTEDHDEDTVISTVPEAGAEVSTGADVTMQVARDRGAKLEQMTRDYLAPGSSIEDHGEAYTIESLDSVKYVGGNIVEYEATVRPFTRLFGDTGFVTGTRKFKGTLEFDDNDQIVGL